MASVLRPKFRCSRSGSSCLESRLWTWCWRRGVTCPAGAHVHVPVELLLEESELAVSQSLRQNSRAVFVLTRPKLQASSENSTALARLRLYAARWSSVTCHVQRPAGRQEARSGKGSSLCQHHTTIGTTLRPWTVKNRSPFAQKSLSAFVSATFLSSAAVTRSP